MTFERNTQTLNNRLGRKKLNKKFSVQPTEFNNSNGKKANNVTLIGLTIDTTNMKMLTEAKSNF